MRRGSNRRPIASSLLVLLAIAVLSNGSVAAEATEATSGLFLIHSAAASVGELPQPTADQQIVLYDYGFLREEERQEPEYFLVSKRPDVPLRLAGRPEIIRGERGLPELLLELSEDAAAEMERVTRENLGSSAALVIDGEVVTAHKIRAVIEGGRIQLSRCTDTACELIYARLLTR